MSRRRSDSEKEVIIYKTLNLEERRRMIKNHHKMRRYEDHSIESIALNSNRNTNTSGSVEHDGNE
jgi:hypothetical protein